MLIPASTVIQHLHSRNIKINGALHIGAHECEELEFYAELGLKPDAIIWIDAMQNKVDQAKERSIPNVFQAVVTDKDDQTISFHVSNNVQSSSVLEFGSHSTHHPHVYFTESVQLKTVTIDSFFQRNNLDMAKCEFWNFDIQGAEMMALKGALNALQFPKAIYIEVNTEEVYKGCAKMDEIDLFLKTYGFERVETNVLHFGWGDALYIRKPMKFYIVDPYAHHKNVESIHKMMSKNNIDYTTCDDLSKIDDSYTVAICANRFFPPEQFPKDCKVVYGPQFFVFPDDSNHPIHKYTYDPTRFFYNSLSRWVLDIHKMFAPNLTLTFVTCPFGLDMDSIKVVPPLEQRTQIMVYFKDRHPDELGIVINLLIEKNVSYNLVQYGSYEDADFKEKLQYTKFVIWLGRHESQGFAFQETLASNVPILLWDVKSMYEEYKNEWLYESYKPTGFSLSATVAPVWSDECGIKIYEASELHAAFDEINYKLNTFSPRKIIEDNVSLEAAYANLLKQISNPVHTDYDLEIARKLWLQNQ